MRFKRHNARRRGIAPKPEAVPLRDNGIGCSHPQIKTVFGIPVLQYRFGFVFVAVVFKRGSPVEGVVGLDRRMGIHFAAFPLVLNKCICEQFDLAAFRFRYCLRPVRYLLRDIIAPVFVVFDRIAGFDRILETVPLVNGFPFVAVPSRYGGIHQIKLYIRIEGRPIVHRPAVINPPPMRFA